MNVISYYEELLRLDTGQTLGNLKQHSSHKPYQLSRAHGLLVNDATLKNTFRRANSFVCRHACSLMPRLVPQLTPCGGGGGGGV